MGISHLHAFLLLFIFLIIGLVFVRFLFVFYSSKKKKFLICGPSKSGKTLLFTQLSWSTAKQTFTSMQENETTLQSGYHVIDIPGHPRIFQVFLDRHKKDARSIIFLIDASKFDLNECSDRLFCLLNEKDLMKTPILVHVNQSRDYDKSASLEKFKDAIENEIENFIQSKNSTLAFIDDGKKKSKHLNLLKNQNFRNRLTWSFGSILDNENINAIKRWIDARS